MKRRALLAIAFATAIACGSEPPAPAVSPEMAAWRRAPPA